MTLPRVVLVGRTNVGKSTLFNRLTESTAAIVSDLPGTTRDRREMLISWRGRSFYLVDTAGMDRKPVSLLSDVVAAKTKASPLRAELLLWVADGQVGLTSEDHELLRSLRKLRRRIPILLAINKIDHPKARKQVSDEFSATGLPSILCSAANGSGTGDLLDEVVLLLPPRPNASAPTPTFHLALVGRPNVGKSSLLNALLNEERVLVHETPHTTRDAVDVPICFREHWITLIDTAGIRRKTRVGRQQEKLDRVQRVRLEDIETQSVGQSLRAMRRAQVLAVVLDLTSPLTQQDITIVNHALEEQKPLCFILNKWDLAKEEIEDSPIAQEQHRADIIKRLTKQFRMAQHFPILLVSAKDRIHVSHMLSCADDLFRASQSKADAAKLNAVLDRQRASLRRRSPDLAATFVDLRETSTSPRVFTLTVRGRQRVPPALLHQLERQLREEFSLLGIPFRIHLHQPSLSP